MSEFLVCEGSIQSPTYHLRVPDAVRITVDAAHSDLGRRLFERREARRLPAARMGRIRAILKTLDSSDPLRALAAPTYRLHPLKGDRQGEWSVRVGGGWCVTFRTDGFNVWVARYDNYHRGHS